MYENIRSKQCPKCGWTCAEEARGCTRCNYQFLDAGGPKSVWKVIASVLTGLAVAVFALLFALAYRMHLVVASTPAYQEGLRLAQSSPELRKALGDHIDVRSSSFGLLLNGYGSRFLEWEVLLAGSRGRAHLYGVANEVNGAWEFSRLTAVPEEGAPKIDLAPKPAMLSLPPVPAKKVYLIPLDLEASESLDWAPSYYQAKLGIEVSVLPALHAQRSLEDSQRRQLEAEKCLAYVRKQSPDLWRDPTAVLVAVTSRDMFIRGLNWSYAENFREDSRYALVSSARLQPMPILGKSNPEWRISRLKKMLTKNIAILYFDLPMSSDYTSLLSGGVLSGMEVDFMSGSIIGAEGQWDSFVDSGGPEVAIYDVPGKPMVWHIGDSFEDLPDTSAQVFDAYLQTGLFVQRQSDFRFDGEYPLQFTRVYTSGDEQSRAFGIGALHSLDIFLVGQMGSHVDLNLEDGRRIHFEHSSEALGGDTYKADGHEYIAAVYAGGSWTISRRDGWKLFMPYRPQALGYKVTVLTGFADSQGHTYRMERNGFGDLLAVETPTGQWLHFQNDSAHRIRRIEASSGRVVNYEYDDKGRLSRVSDSKGHVQVYGYDDRAQMLTIAHGKGDVPVLTNKYDIPGYVEAQTIAGGQKFEYHYVTDTRGPSRGRVPDLITDPNGLLINVRYWPDGYTQSLPMLPPH